MSNDFDYSLEVEVVSSSTNIAQDCIRNIGGHSFDIVNKTYNVIAGEPINIIHTANEDKNGIKQRTTLEEAVEISSKTYTTSASMNLSIHEQLEIFHNKITSAKSWLDIKGSGGSLKGFSLAMNGVSMAASLGSIIINGYSNSNALRSVTHSAFSSSYTENLVSFVGSSTSVKKDELKASMKLLII